MLPKHPDLYEDKPQELEAWVRHLVEDRVSEGPLLDYKKELKQEGQWKREAAKDVSSFANEIGGTIVYGIPEDRKLAIPKEPYGMDPIPGLEEQLGDIYADSILPRLPEQRIKKVELTKYPGKVVYIVWTPESWLGPHMVSAYSEKRYYRRSQLRTVLMEEHEVRLRYERSQTLKSPVYEFLDSQQQLFASWYKSHIERSQPPLISNYILCPLFLQTERVQLFSKDMREWLDANRYVEQNVTREWMSCADGFESSRNETEERRIDFGEVTIYRKGAITRWGKLRVELEENRWLLYPLGKSYFLWKFLEFGAKFYEKISYYGPLWFRVSIYNPTGILLWVISSGFPKEKRSLRSRGQSPLNLDFELSSVDLFKDPKPIVKRMADELYRLFGINEAPPLENKCWTDVFQFG